MIGGELPVASKSATSNRSNKFSIVFVVKDLLPGKYCAFFPGYVPGLNVGSAKSTLPKSTAELLNCLSWGPTSVKSLGTLFMLSFISVINDAFCSLGLVAEIEPV